MTEPTEPEQVKQETWIAPDGEECIIVHRNYPTPERFGAVLLKLIEQEEAQGDRRHSETVIGFSS